MPQGFDTTQWSVVAAAARSGDTDAREALSSLCDRYREPLFAFARRIGHRAADAEDLTQGFFAHLIEKRGLGTARRERGRFRSFLLSSFKHFISDQRDKDQAMKRGGRTRTLSLDGGAEGAAPGLAVEDADTPETLFERKWAHALLQTALTEVRETYESDGSLLLFETLQGSLLGAADESYRAMAGRLGMTEGALKVASHRLRRRFAHTLRAEVARTVDTAEVEDELRHLMSVLSA